LLLQAAAAHKMVAQAVALQAVAAQVVGYFSPHNH
jgi:hypothetical protein